MAVNVIVERFMEFYVKCPVGQAIITENTGMSTSPNGPEFLVNTKTTDDQNYPRTAFLSNGGFVVTWSDSSGDPDGWSVKAQVYDAAGTPVGSEISVNTQTTGNQFFSSIAGLPDGGFVIAWEDGGPSAGDPNGSIKAQTFDNTGSRIGAEFQVNTQTASTQSRPSVAALENGGFVIAWEDRSGTLGDADGSSIKAQVFASDGTKVNSE